MKPPREIAAETPVPAEFGILLRLPPMQATALLEAISARTADAARRGMIEALRWVVHDEPKLGDILSKLAELEKL
jgi:hypothetical protein